MNAATITRPPKPFAERDFVAEELAAVARCQTSRWLLAELSQRQGFPPEARRAFQAEAAAWHRLTVEFRCRADVRARSGVS